MYEQSARWNEYYREQDSAQRRRLFDELCMTEPDDGANEYRLALFKKRYEDEKAPGKEVDRFLFQCVNMMQIGKSHIVFKSGARKEVLKSFELLLFMEAAALGEAGERALYWEIRSGAARYFSTCLSDAYGRSLFGLLKSGDVNRHERMGRDAWDMSEGLTRKLSLPEEGPLLIWNRAVHDAYLACDPNAAKNWDQMLAQEK